MDNNPGLALEGLSRSYGLRKILEGISLNSPAGRITCLLGQSGCGKSSLLRLIAGVDEPDAGTIRLGPDVLVGPGRFVEPERRSIGLMFQDYALFPHLDVSANVAFGVKGRPRESRSECVHETLDLIGIGHLAERAVHSLSGGEQQRVALARALAPKPRMLLMDEPFSNLDQGLRERVRKETVATLRQAGITAIIVTHDPQEALAVADFIVLMRDGRIEQAGGPHDLYDRPVSAYAARFMGPCNTLTGIWESGAVHTPIGMFESGLSLEEGELAEVCIRPQALMLGPDGTGISARVHARTFMGESDQIELVVHPLGEIMRLHSHVRLPVEVGEKVGLHLNGAEAHVFRRSPEPS
jgi:iron(III) transport system ATP-binding protein